MPGPAMVVAEAYTRSPVGPYLAFAVAEPARVGMRAGLCFTTVAVNSPECRVAGRQGWGFPADLADLKWSSRARSGSWCGPSGACASSATPTGWPGRPSSRCARCSDATTDR